MKAMILAAGYGTRLKPLTEKIPKALIKIQHVPLLELVIKKLISLGVDEIIINCHHLSDQIISFLKAKKNFGIKIATIFEPEILGTGGGIKKAAYFFDDNQPFIVHNVDVISTIDLKKMTQFHRANRAIASLAVKERKTTRFLLIDEKNQICGHEDVTNELIRINRQPVGKIQRLGFGGIHVLSPAIFQFMNQVGNFSMVDVYLNLIAQDKKIIGFRTDDYYWKDVGKFDTLKEIETDLNSGLIDMKNLMS